MIIIHWEYTGSHSSSSVINGEPIRKQCLFERFVEFSPRLSIILDKDRTVLLLLHVSKLKIISE